jgi:hypothetical protein
LSAASGEDGVDATQDVGGGLDFAGVHGEQHARGPVEHAVVHALADGLDDLAGETVVVGLGGGLVEG